MGSNIALARTVLIIIIIAIVVLAAIAFSIWLLIGIPSQTMIQTTQTGGVPSGATPIPFTGKKAVFSLVATGLNFNGSSRGSLIIYIPAGWGVEITFTNSRAVGHSIALVRNSTATPQSSDIGSDGSVIASQPTQYSSGISQGSSVVLSVDSVPEGVYWIACGVPGHARSGMWIVLVASPNISAPYAVTTQQTQAGGYPY